MDSVMDYPSVMVSDGDNGVMLDYIVDGDGPSAAPLLSISSRYNPDEQTPPEYLSDDSEVTARQCLIPHNSLSPKVIESSGKVLVLFLNFLQ